MGLFDLFKKKKKEQKEVVTDVVVKPHSLDVQPVDTTESEIAVLFEQLPTTYSLDETGLVEITDSLVLERINMLVPSLGMTGTSIGNVINNMKTITGPSLYRVFLEKGGELADSNAMKGAKRAFTMGSKGIKENANLFEVSKNVDKGLAAANSVSAIMNVASMVVGQYYMKQVDTQLTLMAGQISAVIDFLDDQYKSEVVSLIESVSNIAKFQISSIENEELRGRELDNIQELRKDSQKLINLAEITLERLTSKTCPKYEEYESSIKIIEKWTQYQTILIKILYQLNILDFTLHLGVKSKEQSFASFQTHTAKVENMHTRLVEWHTKQCEAFKINIEESRRKHTGLLGFLEKPISLIKDAWNYQEVNSETIRMIKEQTADIEKTSNSFDNLFNADVEIIARNGKYYYLPLTKEEQLTKSFLN